MPDHIRKVFYESEWWFSFNEGFSEMYEKIVQLKMLTPDGKMRLTDCANMVRAKQKGAASSAPTHYGFKTI